MQRSSSWLGKGIRRWGWYLLILYLVLLGGSHLFLWNRANRETREIREIRETSKDADKQFVRLYGRKLAYLEWGGANAKLPPLILLHGSPSRGARDWEKMAPSLSASGRRIIAIDRWGYGDSEPLVDDYSFEAGRKTVTGLMDALKIEKAHVGGWSYGGGAAIILGDLDRERIVSVSLIASMGIQEGEGSGSYMIEHGKYAVLYALTAWLPEALPHFGLLGSRSHRRAFARDFMDCDQRKMRSHLTTLGVPLFIVHGNHDPLIPAWVAQEHHRLQPRSRLVILDASHFFPLGVGGKENLVIAAREQNKFLAAADQKQADNLYGVRNETGRDNQRAIWNGGPSIRGYKAWWIVALAGVVLGLFTPRSGGLVAGLAGGLLIIDLMTGLGGVLLGSLIVRGENRTRLHRTSMVLPLALLGAILGALLLPVL